MHSRKLHAILIEKNKKSKQKLQHELVIDTQKDDDESPTLRHKKLERVLFSTNASPNSFA